MKITQTGIEGLIVIEPQVYHDDRGYFFESFNWEKCPEQMRHHAFVQDNESYSTRGVLRGLHYQLAPYAQSKLVRVIMGEVLDVAVDIRDESSTYGQHFSVRLSGDNKKQMFVPRGFAHGYVVLSDTAIFSYKCDQVYAKDAEGGIRWDDATLGIDWLLDDADLIVSDKDQRQPAFGEHSRA